ncbi:anti-sigma factor [Amycolatopsis sp. H20-H5]|uniref:anti-sigma factor n=1 Tax=Amycolatopsis sp. H20-H5 TaxID=3046309 RepID=UPI002DC02149|nr:anti-sigma factor [Amycolatopsis sp. H20-H5]MEC3977683.1 anti-sigma factor [Amycolatopsis sp. H20-H5]
MTTPEMHTLAGAFALDAVSDLERAQFQRHLEQCESCSEEVRELRATAARLGAAMAEEPPPALKRRVLAEIHSTRQLSPHARVEPEERSKRSARAPRWVLGLAAAAAVVGLALAGIFGGVALHTQSQLNAAQDQASQQRERYAPVSELLAAPDVRTGHGESSLGGGATVVASRSLNKLMFMGAQLPPHPPGHTYQAWLMSASGPPRSAGLISGGVNDPALLIAGGLDNANRVALSIEQAGGSATGAPSDDVVMVMPVPA